MANTTTSSVENLGMLLVYSAANQGYNLVIVWASTNVDRTVAGTTFPVTWFLTFDGLMTITGVIVALRAWRWLAVRKGEPDTLLKIATSGCLVYVAYLVLGAGATVWPLVPAFVVFVFFLVMDLNWGCCLTQTSP